MLRLMAGCRPRGAAPLA